MLPALPQFERRSEGASAPEKQGIFKLFLGYAPGVGKTYSMLAEAIRRRSRGEDVVIGVVESHGRKAIDELSGRLEAVPRRKLTYKGIDSGEMDRDAILARRPQVVLVDELAHSNIEGSKNSKRYQDVLDLLDAGIDVLSTLNVQHIESLAPLVQNITGVQIRELVPDRILGRVSEIVAADLTVEALKNRMRRGEIYPLNRAEIALTNFFKSCNLIALRELTIQQVARVMARSRESSAEQAESIGKARERIAVGITASPSAQWLIARAFRLADRIDAELFVAYVDTGDDDSPKQQWALDQSFRLAEHLGAQVFHIIGKDIAGELVKLVREKHVTQVMLGHSRRKLWRKGWGFCFPVIDKFLRDAPLVDIHMVTREAR
jgi:two-component system sensor histidine kinase KdpD